MAVPALPNECWGDIDTSCCSNWDTYDPAVQERATALAVSTLRMLTAGRVGGCPITVRPQGDCGLHIWQPGLDAFGNWVNRDFCCIQTEISLPPPVGRVDEVIIDGTILDPTAYEVQGTGILVRKDGLAWPQMQDMSKDLSEAGTWAITYLNAYEVDGLGAYVAGVLACEYAKACSGAKGCRLPSGTVSVVRQGVSYDIQPGAFPDGRTGLHDVDAYLARWNPYAQKAQSQVWSPQTAVRVVP